MSDTTSSGTETQSADAFLSAPQAAEALGLSRQRVHILIRSGALGAVRDGRSVRIPRADVDELLRSTTPGKFHNPEVAGCLTKRQAAERLGVSVHTLAFWLGKGRIKSIRAGARRMIPETEVERMSAELAGA